MRARLVAKNSKPRTRPGTVSIRLVYRLLLLIVSALLLPLPSLQAQDPGTDTDLTARAEALLARMTVDQKVGQLFLVTFVGSDASAGTEIAQMIRQDFVGGVVLLASNSNFYNDADTPRQVAELSNNLQDLALSVPNAVPLFVAVDHEGDVYPYTRITRDTTPLPNPMAIGATWDPANAHDVGEIAGRELAAMGINLLLGPVVDVLNNPQSGGQGDIGTRSFGGDAWWVGQMGRAYVEGVHQGSDGRVGTVAKHFPGHGGSDRLPDEEVATVDKSLQELLRIELAPFIALTQEGGSPDGVTDALMSSHIRYRGFQGNLRQFTAPISFDAEGMSAILGLPEFAPWRRTGVIVSDSLGVPAVRKYFDPTLTTFPHRRIAKEAFLAGNDLLLLSQFDLKSNWSDQVRNMRDAIAYFREEYKSNAAFAARVDEAAIRILRLKLKLFSGMTAEAVRVSPETAGQVTGQGTAVTQRIANQAVTLLYPDANALPQPPRRGEKIVIFTDARPVRECGAERCPLMATLSQTAVQETISRIYGPDGTGQVDPADITSLSFGQLKEFLAAVPEGGGGGSDVDRLLREADWILFACQDLNPVKGPNSDALKLFLNQGLSEAYGARLAVLTFSAPYYLDTTEISKLALYLAAYSKTDPFIETAVRVLFGEMAAAGASPVDVEGINYDLLLQLSPDPEQTIPLALGSSAHPDLPPVDVRLEAGPILDLNGHPVPDGTEVTFYTQYRDGSAYLPPETSTTFGGMSGITLTLTAPGSVQFTVQSGDAAQSPAVEVRIPAPPTPTGTTTPRPSATPVPHTATPTATPTPSPTPTPTTTPTPTALPAPSTPPDRSLVRTVGATDLLLALGVVTVTAAGGLLPARRRRKPGRVLRWVLLAIVGGMLAYILYALGIQPDRWGLLPQASWSGLAGLAALVLVGALLAAGMASLGERGG